MQFDAGDNGLPQLKGWWIPVASQSALTAIYLHGATGNLSDTVSELARLHTAGLNVLAFDYRGYGQSSFVHPSEKRWREDAEAAIHYLTDTRHIPAESLILAGTGLGANLALQTGADHHRLAGVILEDPIDAPADAIFRDPRARLVPAHLLVSDRWQSGPAASDLAIPSLWILRQSETHAPAAYDHVKSRKMIVWLTHSHTADADHADALSRWLAELNSRPASAGYHGAGP
ncbi:MAG: alpha/beta fold hydrolase [Terracidiphilus sp.]